MKKYGVTFQVRLGSFRLKISPYTVFSISYLAYLVSDNQIKDTKGLIMFAEERLGENRVRFIEDNIYDLWWLAVKLGNTYQKESTAALVLWGPLECFPGMCETPESIAKLAVRLLEGSDGAVADFCCGDGSFLLEAVNRERVLHISALKAMRRSGKWLQSGWN